MPAGRSPPRRVRSATSGGLYRLCRVATLLQHILPLAEERLQRGDLMPADACRRRCRRRRLPRQQQQTGQAQLMVTFIAAGTQTIPNITLITMDRLLLTYSAKGNNQISSLSRHLYLCCLRASNLDLEVRRNVGQLLLNQHIRH